jgi:glycosyltransferase involved in cell wall biosynthesis
LPNHYHFNDGRKIQLLVRDLKETRKDRAGTLALMVDVVLPVLNEARALPWVLGRMPEGYVPIVVDNGSADDSAEIAEDLGALVVREPKQGFGAACFAGLQAAADDVVCFMDCDGSLDPQLLPLVADPLVAGEVDLMLGERRPEPGAWPLHARLGNRVIARGVRRRTGIRLRDLGPMRAARREALLDLGIQDRRFGWPLEMVVRAADAGWRITEVPVDYQARTGRSKVTGTVRGTARAVRDMARVLR